MNTVPNVVQSPASGDIKILRELAKQLAEIAADPVQEQRRELWSRHFSLEKTRTPVLVSVTIWTAWGRQTFGDHAMQCADPFFRGHERELRMRLFQAGLGDDFIQEPWVMQRAALLGDWDSPWGLRFERNEPDMDGGAYKPRAPLTDWQDLEKITPTPHGIDRQETARNVERITEAIGDILPVDVVPGPSGPFYCDLNADLATNLARLRGLDRLMMDMHEYPDELHALLALMRDGVLANNQAAEEAGDYSLTTQYNQAMTYALELERPAPNSNPRRRQALWGFCAAQEYTLVSPRFHEEFLLQYQRPIIENFGLVHYGCCEDLTRKIDILRSVRNLRSIAVAPAADLAACAGQIGTDYVLSWRPSPAEMVCCDWDEDFVRAAIRQGLNVCAGNVAHVLLKDIETVQDDPTRLARWVRIVKEIVNE
ncbi:MAG: hypothetical protein QGF67_12145 [Lentisphaeria bacterium]|jgi:hypothetical protein|nr:hypothetical protein [Lentisphaeria bacterium]MDP7742186.1 hypothetical protein [Lentisphaeria bacterium]